MLSIGPRGDVGNAMYSRPKQYTRVPKKEQLGTQKPTFLGGLLCRNFFYWHSLQHTPPFWRAGTLCRTKPNKKIRDILSDRNSVFVNSQTNEQLVSSIQENKFL